MKERESDQPVVIFSFPPLSKGFFQLTFLRHPKAGEGRRPDTRRGRSQRNVEVRFSPPLAPPPSKSEEGPRAGRKRRVERSVNRPPTPLISRLAVKVARRQRSTSGVSLIILRSFFFFFPRPPPPLFCWEVRWSGRDESARLGRVRDWVDRCGKGGGRFPFRITESVRGFRTRRPQPFCGQSLSLGEPPPSPST